MKGSTFRLLPGAVCAILGGAMLLGSTAGAAPYQALIRWQPSASSGVSGYRLYERSSDGEYGDPIDAGLPAVAADGALHWVWPNLDPAQGYAFVVTAYLADGTESAASNELMLDPLDVPPPPSLPAHLFGQATPGPSSPTMTGDYKRASPFALTESGSVSRLWMYLGNPTPFDQQVKGVMYFDENGTPGGMVGQGLVVVVPAGTSPQWIALPFSAPIPLQPWTYWLGAIASGPSSCVYFTGSEPGMRVITADAFADGASDPFGAGTPGSGPIAIFAEYDPAASAPPPSGPHTFGDTTVESNLGVIYGSRKHVSPFDLTETGAISRLQMFISNPSRNPQVMTGIIYTDDGGLPGALMAVGPVVTVAPRTPPGWIALPFAGPVVLPPGRYWIGDMAGPVGGSCYYYFGNQPGARYRQAQDWTAGPSATFGNGSLSPGPISVYAEYDPIAARSTDSTDITPLSRAAAVIACTTACCDGEPCADPDDRVGRQGCDAHGAASVRDHDGTARMRLDAWVGSGTGVPAGKVMIELLDANGTVVYRADVPASAFRRHGGHLVLGRRWRKSDDAAGLRRLVIGRRAGGLLGVRAIAAASPGADVRTVIVHVGDGCVDATVSCTADGTRCR